MKISGPFFHCITIYTLVVVFIFLCDSTQKTSSAEDENALHEIASEPIHRLQADLYRMLPVLIISIFVAVILAIFLAEWCNESSWICRVFYFFVAVLAGIPSAFYGLLCIYFFVFKRETGSYLTHALTFVLLIMPITISTTQQAVKDIDVSIREAAFALGVNKWRVIVEHVIPHAYTDILSGICTTISRAFTVSALILFVFVWTKDSVQFYMPNNVIFLLVAAVLCSVFSSLLKRQPANAN